eukprot:COSAG02_NODE_33507_length_499_cov_0.552500_1_plen_157_part_01
MAISHANRTAENHIRSDGSTFHVVDYDPKTGAVLEKCTNQGLRDNSTWARGQAWCMYGFTMAYRYSHLPNHLAAACRCAEFWLTRTAVEGKPIDGVPLWDFDWPAPQTLNFRDSSAAAIAASALVELAQHSRTTRYQVAAQTIFRSLSENYIGDFSE